MPAARRRRAFLVLLATLAASSVRAEGVVEQLPGDALGFAVVHHLAGANAKIEKLMKIFEGIGESAPPAPLAFIKAATGIGEGLHEQGDAAIALLPGANGAADPRPLFLAPVNDYAKFAESIGGDATGEICRVTIAGEEVLVAKRGDYAMLMNVEHRPTMESLLAAEPKSSAQPLPLADWTAANDFALVLTRAGVEAVTKLGHETVDQQRAAMQEQLGDPEFAEMLQSYEGTFEYCEEVLGFGGAEVQAAGVGMAIDDATNVRISKRIVFVPGGAMAKLDDVNALPHSPLAGFDAQPFVIALGGPIPAQWINQLAGGVRRMSQQFPEENGFEEFDDAHWSKLEESWKANLLGVQSTTTIIQVGDKSDAVLSNIFSITKVDDSQAYLKSSRKSSELWNELLSDSTSDLAENLKHELADVEVAGKPAIKLTVDVVAASEDQNVPMVAPLMKSIFGEDGKLNVHIVAVDKTTIVAGAASKERLVKTIEHAVAGETGLADSSSVQATVKLLEAGAPWQAVVSPQGSVAWVKRIVETVFAQFGGAPAIPDYPDSPTVGFSAAFAGDELHAEMVCPVGMLESLADYIRTCVGK